MKKMILSIAVIAGMFLMTNLNNVNASEKPTISIVTENDGFVEVDLKDLNEKVQASINELANEYDVVKYSIEKMKSSKFIFSIWGLILKNKKHLLFFAIIFLNSDKSLCFP